MVKKHFYPGVNIFFMELLHSFFSSIHSHSCCANLASRLVHNKEVLRVVGLTPEKKKKYLRTKLYIMSISY